MTTQTQNKKIFFVCIYIYTHIIFRTIRSNISSWPDAYYKEKLFVFWKVMKYSLSDHSNDYYSRRVTDTFAGQYLYLLFHSCFPDVDFLQNTIKCMFWDFVKVKNLISVFALHLNSRLSLCERETVMENWPSALQPVWWISVLANTLGC